MEATPATNRSPWRGRGGSGPPTPHSGPRPPTHGQQVQDEVDEGRDHHHHGARVQQDDDEGRVGKGVVLQAQGKWVEEAD